MTALTTYKTWTSATLSSTEMNTYVRDNGNYLLEQIANGGWTSFTPAWTNLTVGNGTNTGKYSPGKLTHFYAEFTFGSTSSISGSVSLDFPVNAAAVTYLSVHPIGWAVLNDSGSSKYIEGVAHWNSTTVMGIAYLSVVSAVLERTALSSTLPFTWATSDKILVHGSYERA